jgi:hypothetical protein
MWQHGYDDFGILKCVCVLSRHADIGISFSNLSSRIGSASRTVGPVQVSGHEEAGVPQANISHSLDCHLLFASEAIQRVIATL